MHIAWKKKIEFFVRFFHHFSVCSWSNKALRRDPDVEIPNLHSKIETGGRGPKPKVPLSLSCSHDFRVTDTQYIGWKTLFS